MHGSFQQIWITCLVRMLINPDRTGTARAHMRPAILREGTGLVNSSRDWSRKSSGYVLLGPDILREDTSLANWSRDLSDSARLTSGNDLLKTRGSAPR